MASAAEAKRRMSLQLSRRRSRLQELLPSFLPLLQQISPNDDNLIGLGTGDEMG